MDVTIIVMTAAEANTALALWDGPNPNAETGIGLIPIPTTNPECPTLTNINPSAAAGIDAEITVYGNFRIPSQALLNPQWIAEQPEAVAYLWTMPVGVINSDLLDVIEEA